MQENGDHTDASQREEYHSSRIKQKCKPDRVGLRPKPKPSLSFVSSLDSQNWFFSLCTPGNTPTSSIKHEQKPSMWTTKIEC
mmetsp:Transcript_10972/g.40867  ORF Transcript_10972/g.40867 Transcript_10972/m.40867 type:complete len:82 (+) Transcript_10972:35-280(+)